MRRKAWVWDAGWLGFDHSWQLQLIKQWGETERGSKVAVHESVCICDCGDATCLDSHASLGLAQATPWISSQITLQYLPEQKTGCAFDCCLILQCSCSLAKEAGLTCYLGHRFSVFSISGTSSHLMSAFFSLPKRKKNPTSEKHTPHLEYKINSNWDTLKLVVGWNKGCMFLPLYCRDIEWWMINDEPK